MRMKTYLLAMALLVGGCGGQEKTVTERNTPPPKRTSNAGVVHFQGITQPADDVVYVVDRSGSMLDILDEIRQAVLQSVQSLEPEQRFHVIFYSSGRPMENPPRKLIFATAESKEKLKKFLTTIEAQGQTYPVPAIRRAFDVQDTDRPRKSVIFLLTDGEFPNSSAVINAITRLNSQKRVSVCTILFHHQSPQAIRVLKTIASKNNGVFKFVDTDD